jgi:hypothetical protein
VLVWGHLPHVLQPLPSEPGWPSQSQVLTHQPQVRLCQWRCCWPGSFGDPEFLGPTVQGGSNVTSGMHTGMGLGGHD